MAQRALVLGSQILGLNGVDNDARRMTAMLESRGFTVDRRTGPDATRVGMLAGYDQLIADSEPDDAAVVYYGGHGYYASTSGAGRAWQCIAPFDLEEGGHDDWRGVTAWELSIKQAQLTERTRNVTVILDCCHSAQLSRGDGVAGVVPRALPHPVHIGFERHLAALRAMYGAAFDSVDSVASPHAVRLVACGRNESAFESQEGGESHGAFTKALIEVLTQVGDSPVSWAAIIGAIRARVIRRFVRQRPDVEGPARRGVFLLTEYDDARGVTVTRAGDRLRLAVGRVSGATVGDVYGVLPADSPAFTSLHGVTEVEVTEVFATTSSIRCIDGADRIERDAVAVPVRLCALKWPVTIEGEGPGRTELEAEILASPTLRIAQHGEPALATLRCTGEGATIEDAGGPLFPPARTPDELHGVVGHLANLGVAQGIRELEGEHGVRASELAIELGIVRNGEMQRIADHGSVLTLRDRYYINVWWMAQRPLYIHVLNINARGKVTLLTDFDRRGLLLDPREPSVLLGQRADGGIFGVGLRWPDGLPKTDLPRLTELIVIAAPAAADLTGLQTRELIVMRDGSQLVQRLAQLCDGKHRSAAGGTLDGFYMKRLSILLAPDQVDGDTSQVGDSHVH